MLNEKYFPSKAPDFRGLNRSVSQMELFSPTSSIRSGSLLVGSIQLSKNWKVWDEQQDVNLVPRPLSRAPLFNVASANPGTKKTGTGTKLHSFLLILGNALLLSVLRLQKLLSGPLPSIYGKCLLFLHDVLLKYMWFMILLYIQNIVYIVLTVLRCAAYKTLFYNCLTCT